MQISAAVTRTTDAPFEIARVQLDDPRTDEVLVRLAASGVCASDAHTRSGRIPSPLPVVLGHEGAGVVVAVGANVTHVAPGDHVALSWMPSCGRCRFCAAGRPVLCRAAAGALLAGTLLDGSSRLHEETGVDVSHYSFLSTFATHTVVPAASAVPIPRTVPLPIAALVGCAVLTGYGAVVNRARVKAGDSVVVFGAGGVGLSAVMAARLAGAAQVIVVDPVVQKRAAAVELGATHALEPGDDLVAHIQALTGGDGADVAIDAVGAPGILDDAFRATVAGGTIVCVGVPSPDARPSVPGPDLVRSERVIMGCLYGSSRPTVDIPIILDLYSRGLLPLDLLVSKTYRLEQVNEAFDDLADGRLSRGVLIFDGPDADDPDVDIAGAHSVASDLALDGAVAR